MADVIRVMIERGPKKKVVASAFDWPGWDRNGKSDEDALQVLERYRPRYRKVAELASLAGEFDAARELEVVERIEGSSPTDYFGISAKSASAEYAQMASAECERKLGLLVACWQYFDYTHPRISSELRKGPRGGGRDRDQIVRHTYVSEFDLAKKIGVDWDSEVMRDPDRMRAYRERFQSAIRTHNAGGISARSWTLKYLIRRTCYHVLDHAWELEDKDLTGAF